MAASLRRLGCVGGFCLRLLGGRAGGCRLGLGLLLNGLLLLLRKGVDFVLAIVADKVGKVLHGTGTAVVNRRVLRASREELNGREATDIIRDIIACGINLGDGHL